MSDAELLLRLARRLGPEDPEAMRAALLERPAFQGDLAWLRLLFSVADTLPQPEADDGLVARLRAIPASEKPELYRDRRVEMAVQIHDSRDEGQLVGLRGSEYRNRDVWTAVFSAPSADLIIDGTPTDDGTTRLVGHFLPRAEGAAHCHVTGGGLDEPLTSDEDGRFVIHDVADGVYQFEVVSGDISIQCTFEVKHG